VKLESYDEFKEARWINSRSDYFKAYSGRFFKAIEKAVYQVPNFIKHVPVPERPAMIAALRKAGYYYYENDYKAFESHFTRQIMDVCELTLYRHCLQSYPDDAEFICNVIGGRNRLHCGNGVSVEVDARRMSGDMCTSLGNGFTNLMIYLFICERKGLTGEGFVEGDDGLFALTGELSVEDFSALGFTVELHKLEDPCEGHFCGMSCSQSLQLVKDPRRVFKTFGWTSSYIDAGWNVMDSLLRSKALSLAYELPSCPILGVLAREALRATRGVKVTHAEKHWGRYIPADESEIAEFAPTVETRLFFEKKFLIDVPTQLIVEGLIRDHQFDQIKYHIPPTSDELLYSTRYVEAG